MSVKVYLAGGMQYASNLGAGWREDITPFLKELDIEVYDPVILENEKLKGINTHTLPKVCINRLTGEEYVPEYWHDLAKSVNPDHVERHNRIMNHIKNFDLDIVRNVDFLIVWWDKKTAKGSGTRAEMELAKSMGKPVYVIEKVNPSSWTTESISKFFSTVDDLKEFLRENYGEKD